ncbi:hypothetical protein V6N11_067299 [Hibiscus sabdariffa]|uniref:RNase H type-1 domain-containing protein n=1 Tax=Hibiscus sabdariffa TaxID=183260 RepID=A0ABR2SQN2_9ROSI
MPIVFLFGVQLLVLDEQVVVGAWTSLPMCYLGIFKNESLKTLGPTNVVQAELWGVYEGLKLARQNGFERIAIQMDKVNVYKLLYAPSPMSLYTMVRSIVNLCSKAWVVDFHLVQSEVNTTVDYKAKIESSQDMAYTIVDFPPDNLFPCCLEISMILITYV